MAGSTLGWADALLAPRGIALVGASDDCSRIAGRALGYLLRNGYDGSIHPVNHHRRTVQGLATYPRVSDVPDPIDLAVISLPAPLVLSALRDCATRGISAAILYASGFAETGEKGRAHEEGIRQLARETGIRVLGPNCLGAISFPNAVTATFTSALEEGELGQGPVVLLTQSGAFASFVFDAGRAAGLGFPFLANTGNEADLTAADLLDVLVAVPEVAVVLMHLEGVRDLATFECAAARARQLAKPVVVVKVGRTKAGAAAANAHAGSDAGNDAAYNELFRQWGIHRVESMEALVDAGCVFSSPRRPAGRKAAVISISGGTGALIADACEKVGLEVPEYDENFRGRLAGLLPWFASTRNPVDVTGGVLDDLDMFAAVLDLCAGDNSTDVLLVAVGNVPVGEDKLTDAIVKTAARHSKPLVVAWVGGSGRPARRLAQACIPTFPDPTRAVRATALAVRHFLPAEQNSDASVRSMAPPARD